MRTKLKEQYALSTQFEAALWGLSLINHIVPLLDQSKVNLVEIQSEIEVLQRWIDGKATIYEIRQASFIIHALARACSQKAIKSVLRSIGHAISIGHMSEHAMVASDYAIQAIGFMYNENMYEITEERRWQIEQFKIILNNRNLL